MCVPVESIHVTRTVVPGAWDLRMGPSWSAERTLAPSILRHAGATHPETIARGSTAVSADYVTPGAFVLGG